MDNYKSHIKMRTTKNAAITKGNNCGIQRERQKGRKNTCIELRKINDQRLKKFAHTIVREQCCCALKNQSSIKFTTRAVELRKLNYIPQGKINKKKNNFCRMFLLNRLIKGI